MKLLIILTLLVIHIKTFSQNDTTFIVKEFINNKNVHYLNKYDFSFKNKIIFEDSIYEARSSCQGEWGGTLFFKNKISHKIYFVDATCPVSINKIDNKYYISNTLMHGLGSSTILEIVNPDSLMDYQICLKDKGIKTSKLIHNMEIYSRKGSKTITESNYGEFIITSFVYSNQLYHIVSDYETTYLANIKEKTFKKLGTVSQKSLWTYNPLVYKTKDNHLIVFFENDHAEGYIDIFENKITVIRTK